MSATDQTQQQPEPEVPETGAVFTFGKSKFAENAPSKFWIKRDLIVELSCGDEHTAVVTESGRMFTFGSNEWGQLGLGHSNNVIKPSCVKSLKPDKVSLVACGKAHTVVVMRSRRMFAFGSNAEGQLGVGRTPDYTDKPIEIVPAIKEEVSQLSAGSAHSMALGKDSGKIYVWGSNTEGQLGLGTDGEETVFSPAILDLSVLSRVKQLSCGYYHSAFVTSEGFLHVFGDSDGGKLGLGEDAAMDAGPCDEPTKIELPEKVQKIPISFSSRCMR